MVQHVSQWQGTQCDFTMENGEIQLMRVPPSARNLTTEAELAADFAAKEARRVLKDFPVPAYSFCGGLYVVTPKQLATSATGSHLSVTCLTASILNSSI